MRHPVNVAEPKGLEVGLSITHPDGQGIRRPGSALGSSAWPWGDGPALGTVVVFATIGDRRCATTTRIGAQPRSASFADVAGWISRVLQLHSDDLPMLEHWAYIKHLRTAQCFTIAGCGLV